MFAIRRSDGAFFTGWGDEGAEWSLSRRLAKKYEVSPIASCPPGCQVVELKPIGFAAISPERRSEISRAGGKAAHVAGTAHEFTPEQAREAGRKGGQAVHAKRRAAGG